MLALAVALVVLEAMAVAMEVAMAMSVEMAVAMAMSVEVEAILLEVVLEAVPSQDPRPRLRLQQRRCIPLDSYVLLLFTFQFTV